jgi:phage terminase large subunit-like protein
LEVEDLIHPCTQYALDIVEKRRIVGRSEYLACKRHLDDLERQGSEEFPWIFDEAKANKIYDWFHYCHHVKGALAGQPIELEPFQKFDLGCIFGWVHKDTGLRKYEKSFSLMARKNAKSTIMSGIALYLMAGDKEESPEVYCAAVDREQARIVWKDARSMAQKSPDIRKRLKIRNNLITHLTRGGELIPLSKETKNKDGYNPSGAIIDEYHAHSTSEIYDLIWSAWGQRNQALMAIISTAGFETVENPCYDEYTYCKKILTGEIVNERYFVMIRELDPDDDEHNPSIWIKANPLRAATPAGLAKLKEQHDEAFNSGIPEKIRNFRVKNLNKWVNESESGYIGDHIHKWKELAVSRDEFLELTRGLSCINGADLSKKIDLTGDGFAFLLPDGRYAVCAQGFIPAAAISKHEKTDDVPYREWAKAGWITETPGEVTDYHEIETYIHDMELEGKWKIEEFAYDPYNATQFANTLMDEGYTCVEIRQGVQTLSEPTKLFREAIISGNLVHDGSPALTWCLANAVVAQDSNENIKLSKKNASDAKRIDLLAAVINAMVRVHILEEGGDISDEILDDEWGM